MGKRTKAPQPTATPMHTSEAILDHSDASQPTNRPKTCPWTKEAPADSQNRELNQAVVLFFVFITVFKFSATSCSLCDLSSPNQGLNLGPWQSKP